MDQKDRDAIEALVAGSDATADSFIHDDAVMGMLAREATPALAPDLIAENEALTATAKDYAAEAVQYRRERDEAKAELTALRAKLVEARQTSLRDVLAYEAGVEDGKQEARGCAAERDRVVARCEELAKELAEARAKMAAAEKDGERLDALLNGAVVMARAQSGHFILHQKDQAPFNWKRLDAVTRSDIDAAIAAGKGE